MNATKILCLLAILLATYCALATAQEDSAPKRPNPLLRKPIGRNNVLAKKASTTTTPPPLADDEEYADEDVDGAGASGEQFDDGNDDAEEAAAAPTTTTTTEPPKKIGPIIRPFRSNDDLLNALKRRQQNMKSGKKAVPQKIASVENQSNEDDAGEAPAPVASHKTSEKVGRKRFGGRGAEPIQAEAPQPSDEAAQTVRRPGRSRFGLVRPSANL